MQIVGREAEYDVPRAFRRLAEDPGQGHLVFSALGPIGLAAMQGLNFGLRYDYLMKSYAADPWGGPLENVLFLSRLPSFLGSRWSAR